MKFETLSPQSSLRKIEEVIIQMVNDDEEEEDHNDGNDRRIDGQIIDGQIGV